MAEPIGDEMAQAGGVVVEKLIYEVLSDEELLQVGPARWRWSGELGRFVCTITSDPPPIRATRLATEGKASTELVPAGPTLVAVPQFSEASVERIRAELEGVLSGWVAHLELAEGIAIRFVYRDAWLRVPDDAGGRLERHRITTVRGGTIRIVRSLDEVPPRPPDWLTHEPEFTRLLREQWREARLGRAKLLDRAYFCLTAIEQHYGQGQRADAAKALGVSREVLGQIGPASRHQRSSACAEAERPNDPRVHRRRREVVEGRDAAADLANRGSRIECAGPPITNHADLRKLT